MQNLLVILVILIVFSAALVGYNQLDAANTRSQAINTFLKAWDNSKKAEQKIIAAKHLVDVYGSSKPWLDGLPLAMKNETPKPELCQDLENQIITKTSFREISADAELLGQVSQIIGCKQ